MADKNDLTSRKARAKLKVQNTIYWKTLKPGKLHLGYAKRKAGEAGIWIMRTHVGKAATGRGSPYLKQNLGIADDLASDDRLSFVQAQAKAFELHVVREKQKKAGVKTGPLTVNDLTADYLKHLESRGPEDSGRQTSDRHAHQRRARRQKGRGPDHPPTDQVARCHGRRASPVTDGTGQTAAASGPRPLLRRRSAPAARRSTEP